MTRITDKGREKQHRGEGTGAQYTPWIKARDFHNQGTGSVIVDWKTGRKVHLLSQGEKYAYYILRWDDNVTDIREQFPLKKEETMKIAEVYGLRHPEGRMTTDLLVTYKDGRMVAYSVKPRKKDIAEISSNTYKQAKNDRTIEKLFIEKSYWKLHGVPFKMLFKDEMNRILAENLQIIMFYYDKKEVRSRQDLVLHLLAHKKITADLETVPIANSIPALVNEYLNESSKWNELKELAAGTQVS